MHDEEYLSWVWAEIPYRVTQIEEWQKKTSRKSDQKNFPYSSTRTHINTSLIYLIKCVSLYEK